MPHSRSFTVYTPISPSLILTPSYNLQCWSHTTSKWHSEVCLPPGLELLPQWAKLEQGRQPRDPCSGKAPSLGMWWAGLLLSLPSRARAAHLTDQAVVGVEITVDDVHGVEVGLGVRGMEVRRQLC